jgi:ribonucleoside-diphosphate reductase alpha chain
VANQVIETNDSGVETGKAGIESTLSYQDLNAMINLWSEDQKLQLEKDKIAVRRYFLDHVNQNTVFFHSLKERLDYLVEHEYY